MTSSESLKVIPLGGVEEIGINSTVIEYENQLIVIDLGLGFPDANMYGIDYVVPNIDYLIENKSKIEAIFITHGHLDHIGGLPYLLDKLDFPPLYGTPFTLELIKASLEEHNLLSKVRLNAIDPSSVLKSGNFTVSFFRVNHSIPQCVGIVVETPAGRIVHTGDFKFDNSPVNEPVADYARMAQVGLAGVDLLLSDSTNSFKRGHPISESDVAVRLGDMVERSKGRVIIASFSGLIGRLYQLIKIAEMNNRKVAIAGFSMNQTLRIAEEIGYIKPKPGTIVPTQRINKFSDNKVMILTTGSQGESNAALARMASGKHKDIHLKAGDTVIISAGTIPGNNTAVQNLIDGITSKGAIVRQSEDMDFFTSGHGYQEDQKIMLNLIKPKFFMPVHGYQYFLREHARTAVQVGIPENNIIIAKRGSVVMGNSKSGFKIEKQLRNTPLLVSGSGVGDIGMAVLAERQQLGNHGVVTITINANMRTMHLLDDPHVFTKGFVYVKTSQDLIAEISEEAKKIFVSQLRKTKDLNEIKLFMSEKILALVNKQTGREPVIMPLINLIDMQKRPVDPNAPVQTRKPLSQKSSRPQHQPHPKQVAKPQEKPAQ